MSEKTHIFVHELREKSNMLHAGDGILLSGTVYCARDAAHKRLMTLISEGAPLPFEMDGAVIYYCGPTPAKPDMPIGSAGPTTSTRMDSFMPTLLDMGLLATIGKGGRSSEACRAMLEHKAIYLCAVGGAGAIAASRIKSCEVIAFPELGCESVKKMVFDRFPLVVGIDINGNSVFK